MLTDRSLLHVACPVNEYIDPASPPGLPICIPCPANSASAGGNATVCMCSAGTGRVDESDVTLSCLGEYLHTIKSDYMGLMLAFDIRCSSKQLKDVLAASAFVNCVQNPACHIVFIVIMQQ